MLHTVLTALLPVAFAIALGWLSGRLGYLRHEHADVFAIFVLRFALPLSLLGGALHATAAEIANLPFLFCLAFGLMGTYVLAILAGLFLFGHDLKTSTIQALVCAFPDMAYFGAPVLAAVIGPTGFLAVLVGNLVTSLLMLPATIFLVSLGDRHSGNQAEPASPTQSPAQIFVGSLLNAVCNPIVWVPVGGAVITLAGLRLPGPVLASVDIIGHASGGTSLFALGLMFYGERFKIDREVLANIGFKNFVQPALMVFGVVLFHLSGPLAHQVILTGAVPTATAAGMFAIRAHAYMAPAAATILISTLLGLATEAAVIAALPGL
jgi:malonate transporter